MPLHSERITIELNPVRSNRTVSSCIFRAIGIIRLAHSTSCLHSLIELHHGVGVRFHCLLIIQGAAHAFSHGTGLLALSVFTQRITIGLGLLDPLLHSRISWHDHRGSVVLSFFRSDLALEEKPLLDQVIALGPVLLIEKAIPHRYGF